MPRSNRTEVKPVIGLCVVNAQGVLRGKTYHKQRAATPNYPSLEKAESRV
jgi:hypothetical protein